LKVLFVCPWVPWPLDDGGRIRTYNLLRAVAPAAEVHLLAVREPDGESAALAALAPCCASVRVFERTRPGLWTRWTWSKLERWVHSPVLAAEVRAELATGSYDVAHLDELLLTRLPAGQGSTPIVQHHHKIDSVLYARLGGRRVVTHFDLWKLRRLERESARLWRHHVVCSAEDAAVLHARYPQLSCSAIPSGYDPEHFRPRDPAPERAPATLLFLGSMSYGPNADAAARFVHEVLPALLRTHPTLELEIVGKAPSPEVRALAGPNVRVVGAVPDVRPYLERATLMVVPLRIGGGTRLKIVEAMAMGCPVVSTPVGAAGLDLVDREHLLLAEDSARFAARVAELIAEPELGQELAGKAREHVAARFTWHALGGRLVEAWERARG
jgi:glycosyltransferase involved in cell wall biosynthesis